MIKFRELAVVGFTILHFSKRFLPKPAESPIVFSDVSLTRGLVHVILVLIQINSKPPRECVQLGGVKTNCFNQCSL